MNLATIAAKTAVVGGPKVQLALAKANKYSPQILTGVGVIGAIGSTVLIARATLKLEELVADHENYLDFIKYQLEDGKFPNDKDHKHAITMAYVRFCLALAKIYGPGVSLGIASYISIIAGQGLAQKRQVALVAAVKSAESALQAYRARVIDAIGAEKEADIRYGISTETLEDEDGKKVKVKSFDPSGLSEYEVMYDQSNPNWERGNRELNFLTLKNQQQWANNRLEARGFVYLNEVRGWLGLPQTPAGQVLGWLHRDAGGRDGYIDFGWEKNPVNTQAGKFGDHADGILLSFNCDGEINSKL